MGLWLPLNKMLSPFGYALVVLIVLNTALRGIESTAFLCAIGAIIGATLWAFADRAFDIAAEVVSVWHRVGRWARFHLSVIAPDLYIGRIKRYPCRGYLSFAVVPYLDNSKHARIAAFLYHESDLVTCDDFKRYCGDERITFAVIFIPSRQCPEFLFIRVEIIPMQEKFAVTRLPDGGGEQCDAVLGDVSIDTLLDQL
ncbi:MAG: hypothetical protein KGL39_18835 [Patescibacteria group bacterium]|nr:hypothetical protein [Patescibacteria group bacterium]